MPHRFSVYDAAHPHFITSTILHWIPVFSREDYFRVLVDSLKYCIAQKGLLVHCYVLMPNHFHLICSQIEARLTEVMRDMKTFTSKEIARMLEADGRALWLTAMRRGAGQSTGVKVWQDAYHPEQVHSESFFRQKMDYLHDNPRRAGYVSDPCDWKYSSAGLYYRNSESPVPVTPIEW
jgi:REP element-mobilizing transposase RayT